MKIWELSGITDFAIYKKFKFFLKTENVRKIWENEI